MVGWLIFSYGFRIFVALFSNFPATYGAIAGIVILMLWLNNSALLILIGAKINAFRYDRAVADAQPRPTPSPQPALTPSAASLGPSVPTPAWRREQRRWLAAAIGLWTCLILIGALRGGRSSE
jgi:membrane protein